ncbi:YHS domain-containing protein [Skermanella rosea]|uniref:YHS domain-containing (seleno)protein n=1 Tax=Skermanella rosea TaxID=1817965 RepID=UPI0019341002|nr:YHS domain-containing (seleno)protein [Skermanella rosea]UEM02859.1 YHS domain-containing protein [Skermanella rosea]
MSRSAVRPLIVALAALAAVGSFSPPALAKEAVIYTGFFSSVAVGGYDPVAYFTQGRPVEGSKEFSTRWMDAEWRFASAANRDLFIAAPEKYAPQYGGYCAWAIAQNKTASGDPKLWKVVDGKLYLNYDQDVQQRWEKDIPGFIASADRNWPAVLGK